MSDLSYEVNDEFNISTVSSAFNSSESGQVPRLLFSDLNISTIGEGTGSSGQEQLIETKKVTQAVNTDRRLYLDFVVLKVMKRLRLCSYEAMLAEVVPQLKFGLLRTNVEPRISYLAQIGRLELWDEKPTGEAQPAGGGTQQQTSMQVDEEAGKAVS